MLTSLCFNAPFCPALEPLENLTTAVVPGLMSSAGEPLEVSSSMHSYKNVMQTKYSKSILPISIYIQTSRVPPNAGSCPDTHFYVCVMHAFQVFMSNSCETSQWSQRPQSCHLSILLRFPGSGRELQSGRSERWTEHRPVGLEEHPACREGYWSCWMLLNKRHSSTTLP